MLDRHSALCFTNDQGGLLSYYIYDCSIRIGSILPELPQPGQVRPEMASYFEAAFFLICKFSSASEARTYMGTAVAISRCRPCIASSPAIRPSVAADGDQS